MSSTKTRDGESLLISSSVNRRKTAPLVELFRFYVKGAVKAEPCRKDVGPAALVVEHDEGISVCADSPWREPLSAAAPKRNHIATSFEVPRCPRVQP
jgi:hypothetical protein